MNFLSLLIRPCSFLFLFSIGYGLPILNAQWVEQSTPTTNGLNEVHFVDANTGWAAGGNGTILNTTDGGTTWNEQSTPLSHPLRDIEFADPSNGWAVGMFGTVLHTSDGGANWVSQNSGVGQGISLEGIAVLSPSEAFAVGDSLTVIHTTDSGSTWSVEHSSNMEWGLHDIHFVNPSLGWAIGPEGLPYSKVLRTTDGGTTWNTVKDSIDHYCRAIHFANDSMGWIGGPNGHVLHSSDSGKTWAEQALGGSVAVRDLHFPTSSEGWVVGDNGKILHSADGGDSWKSQSSGTSEDLWGLHFVDDANGWAVSTYGTIHHTDNGGVMSVGKREEEATWKLFPTPTKDRIQVEFDRSYKQVQYELLDLQGRSIRSRKLNNSVRLEFPIDGPPGLYFLRIRTEDHERSFKVVKE